MLTSSGHRKRGTKSRKRGTNSYNPCHVFLISCHVWMISCHVFEVSTRPASASKVPLLRPRSGRYIQSELEKMSNHKKTSTGFQRVVDAISMLEMCTIYTVLSTKIASRSSGSQRLRMKHIVTRNLSNLIKKDKFGASYKAFESSNLSNLIRMHQFGASYKAFESSNLSNLTKKHQFGASYRAFESSNLSKCRNLE